LKLLLAQYDASRAEGLANDLGLPTLARFGLEQDFAAQSMLPGPHQFRIRNDLARPSREAIDDPVKTLAGSCEMLLWYGSDTQKKSRSSGSRARVPG